MPLAYSVFYNIDGDVTAQNVVTGGVNVGAVADHSAVWLFLCRYTINTPLTDTVTDNASPPNSYSLVASTTNGGGQPQSWELWVADDVKGSPSLIVTWNDATHPSYIAGSMGLVLTGQDLSGSFALGTNIPGNAVSTGPVFGNAVSATVSPNLYLVFGGNQAYNQSAVWTYAGSGGSTKDTAFDEVMTNYFSACLWRQAAPAASVHVSVVCPADNPAYWTGFIAIAIAAAPSTGGGPLYSGL